MILVLHYQFAGNHARHASRARAPNAEEVHVTPHRWMMKAVGEPLVKEPLALGAPAAGHVLVEVAGWGVGGGKGRAVLVPAVMPCGECDACRRGKGTICPSQKMPGNDIHGGFATHLEVPARGLCPVDEARLARVGLGLADVSVVAD